MVADFFMGCVSGRVLPRETRPAELENSCRSFCIFCTKNKKNIGRNSRKRAEAFGLAGGGFWTFGQTIEHILGENSVSFMEELEIQLSMLLVVAV